MKKVHVRNAVLFICLFAMFFSKVQRVYIPKWKYIPGFSEGSTDRYQGFYQLAQNSLDYIVIGASHSFYSNNPMQIYAETGLTGYNLGSPSQPVNISYYWLKEACKYQKPTFVCFDVVSLIMSERSITPARVSEALANMRPSLNKLQAAINCTAPEQNVREILFPMIRFHNRWNDLNKQDFINRLSDDYMVKGAYLNFNSELNTVKTEVNYRLAVRAALYDGSLDYIKDNIEISANNQEYFKRIVDLCKKNNIQFIPIKFPSLDWSEEKSQYVRDFLSDYDLPLIDLSDGRELKINWETDTCDSGRHINYYGALKTSRFLGKYLQMLQAVKKGTNWDEDLKQYQLWEQEQLITDEQKALQYLQKLISNEKNLYIIFSVKDEACKGWNEQLQRSIQSLGLKSDFYNNIQNSFIAVIDGGNVLFEQWSDAPLVFETNFTLAQDIQIPVSIASGGLLYGCNSSVEIGGIEHSLNQRGINIVIIDKISNTVVSSVALDTYKPQLSFYEKEMPKEAIDIWNSYQEQQLLDDGIYTIAAAADPKYVVDISGGDTRAGTNVALWMRNGLDTQEFELKYVGCGLYTLRSLCSDKNISLDFINNDSELFNVIQDYPTNLATQEWFIVQNPNQTYSLLSLYNGLALDYPNGDAVAGNNIQAFIRNNYPAQQFIFEKLE